MNVNDAVLSRRSIRAFLDRPVAPDIVRRVLQTALRAPSGCNLQPWIVHVLTGDRLSALKALMRGRVAEQPEGEMTEYDITPPGLRDMSDYQRRLMELGQDLYGHLGIARGDKVARAAWNARNFEFFGAPIGLFCAIDRRMGPPQWADLGMFLQTIMLLLREEGLDSCAQESWALYPATVGGFIGLPETQMLFCGMAIGYADPDAPANRLRARREALEDAVTFHGF